MIKEHGIDSIVQSDFTEVSFRILNPIVFLPSYHKTESYVIKVKDWDVEIPPVLVKIPSEPIIYACFCRYYNKRYATVSVEKEERNYDYKMHTLQLDKGSFITTTSTKVDIPNRGSHIYSRINKRTAAWHHLVFSENASVDRFHIKNFCRLNHDIEDEVYKMYCAACRGHRTGTPRLRKCDCVGRGDVREYPPPAFDPDQMIMEWDPFGRQRP
jgi:hypothetical protein